MSCFLEARSKRPAKKTFLRPSPLRICFKRLVMATLV
uniref:Uncharacterized protein n=1 Tax=Timema tahoe TaxID=61484 RepID=A0A7R9FK31_9NEOP|nr:unnamed protein product [Timema tahoe]